jgi:hypothetical protein
VGLVLLAEFNQMGSRTAGSLMIPCHLLARRHQCMAHADRMSENPLLSQTWNLLADSGRCYSALMIR